MNLFVIETPLQLLNAIEAQEYFGLRHSHLLILYRDFAKASFEPLLRDGKWASVTYFWFPDIYRQSGSGLPNGLGEAVTTIRQGFLRARLERALRRYGRVERIFLGNYLELHKYYMWHVHHVVPHDSVVLLDDGTDTLVVNEQLARPRARPEKRRHVLRRLRQSLRRRLIDWHDRPADSLTFFTVFDLAVRPSDTILRNRYEHLRQSLKKAESTDQILFLGQSLVEDGYLGLADYLHALGGALAGLGGKRIVYVPHPREEQATIEAVRRTYGLETERPILPIECHIIASNRMPQEIASFFCSALVNCSAIFGDLVKVSSFRLDETTIIRHREISRSVYAYLESLGQGRIRMIELRVA